MTNVGINYKNTSFLDKINDILVVSFIISIYIFSTNENLNLYYKMSALIFIGFTLFKKLIKKEKFIFSLYTFRALVFTIYCSLSLSWAFVPNKDIVIVLFLVTSVTFTLINYVNDYKKFEIVLIGLIIAGILLCAHVFINVGLDTLINSRFELKGYNSNDVGIKIAISSLASIYFITNKKRIKLNYFVLMLVIPFVLFSNSKKAVILLVFGIVLYFVLRANQMSKKVKYVFFSVLLLLIVCYAMFNIEWLYSSIGIRFETLLNQVIYGRNGSQSDTLRIDFINYGLHLAKTKPLFGYGIDNFRYIIGSYLSVNTYAHNNYIELLVDVGMIGLFLYYINFFYTFKALTKLYNNNKELIALPLVLIIIMPLMDIALVSFNEVFYNIIVALCYSVTRFISVNNCDKDKRI